MRNLQKEFLQILFDESMWIGDNSSRTGDEERQIIEADDFENIAKRMAELADEVKIEATEEAFHKRIEELEKEVERSFTNGVSLK